MLGSHIDTVIDAGIYDGCYGVLSALEVIQTLKEDGFAPSRPIVVAAFTNEEGVRYAPDMMGSLVYAGGLPTETALATVGADGTMLGGELGRIGYAGPHEPGFLSPHAYIELHIEQGPVLERESITIGAVENVQGISWQKVTVEGDANHAGTTPISMRRDAGYAAARIITFLRERAKNSNSPTVATVGCISFEPNAINVIPSRATLTVDLRDPDEERLRQAEAALAEFLDAISQEEHVEVSVERLARFEPVRFDQRIVAKIEKAAKDRGLTSRRMTSGAGHDAQMIARIAPAAMIFVPSVAGISHNPKERTNDEHLIAGANVLLDVVGELARR
ncbi:N-carbamoyl-L-amino acid hydrolase (plasmid) [Rhizobium favelukesii]|uniref:N-carbamoyl-L-amino acid hydrolase n=1 Tax=Rhizobium favelukesii TaxID=348824 RepID=W6S938_9HYPH|nr:N-carbamoyl-L-amino acid hydrolase [Rhizobium favelukesii]